MRYTKELFRVIVVSCCLLISGCGVDNISDNSDGVTGTEMPVQTEVIKQKPNFNYNEYLGTWYAYVNDEDEEPIVKMVFGVGEGNMITVETTPVTDNPDFSSFKNAEFISDSIAVCSDGDWLGTPVRFKLDFSQSEDKCILETIEAATNKNMLENLILYRTAERQQAVVPSTPQPKPVATAKPRPDVTKRNEFEQKAEAIESYAINNLDTAMNQHEINRQSGLVYTKWDNLLNEVYQYLKKTMPSGEFSKLNSDEKAWIKKKEKAIAAAGAEWEGGSGEAMARNYTGIDYTRERCYYLISLVEQQ